MKSNVWDGQGWVEGVKNFHQDKMEELRLPKWMIFECPFCKVKMPVRDIRSFELKFNAVNFGDICVQFACSNCNIMETMYIRKAFRSIEEGVGSLKNDHFDEDKEVVTEEEMYKLCANNLMDRMSEENPPK